MFNLVSIFLLLVASSCAYPDVDANPGFELIASDAITAGTEAGLITATEWRYSDEGGESIGLHRYQRQRGTPHAILLYLPGTNMNGVLKTRNEDQNLWLFLAARGVTVYAMDYRTRFIPHDFAGDLAFMADWTMVRFVEDAGMALEHARAASPDLPVYIAGFSRGASYAYALAGQPDIAGLIILDGSFKQTPYTAFNRTAALQQLESSGRFASVVSRRGWAKRSELMMRVISDPDGKAANPRYDTAADHLSDVLYKAWGPGVLSNTKDDVSDIQVLAREMQSYDWFFPLIQDVEGASLRSEEDDPHTSIDDHYGEMTLPILYFGAGRVGAESLVAGIHSAARSGSKDVSIQVLENYGHLDVLFSESAVSDVYQVILDWINIKKESNE
jgi:alpha-beta hydrolase superfamily lysophospholipase